MADGVIVVGGENLVDLIQTDLGSGLTYQAKPGGSPFNCSMAERLDRSRFLAVQTPWGGFPGHTLDDVGSGIGTVHNTYMFDKPERTVIYAPFRPFPRTLLSGGMTLLPKPPWFITNKRGVQLGKGLTEFAYKPSWFKVPGGFIDALRG